MGICASCISIWSCRWRHCSSLLGTLAQPYSHVARLRQSGRNRFHESYSRRSVCVQCFERLNADHCSGQYHWVSELAPPRLQKGLSYTTGWLITLGWQTFLCGVSFSVASLILGLATLGSPDYEIQPWHQTLLTICIVACCALYNVFLAVRLPLTEAVVLVLHVLGVFGIIIPLWVLAPRGNVHDTILKFTNSGGWENDGLAIVIGMVPMIGMLIVGGNKNCSNIGTADQVSRVTIVVFTCPKRPTMHH